jgi:ATP adenylyltransferase
LKRGKYSFIVLNAYPYNNGHLMIAPYRHVVYPNDLTVEESMEIMDFISLSIDVLKRALSPDGFNIGVNIGRAAGAGVEHLHFHVVPRWIGDTNFMPTLSETKVISQHIRSTFEVLKKFL